MAIYKGLVDHSSIVRVNDSRVRILSVDPTAVRIQFPEDVSRAFVQATNWYDNDAIEFEALTVWGSDTDHTVLTFGRLPDSDERWIVGHLSFQVETK